MAHNDPGVVNPGELDHLVRSLWPIRGGQAVIYDGQFGPPDREADFARSAAATCIAAGRRLRQRHRYVYQQELKSLAGYLSGMPDRSLHLRFLRKCNRWFPRDRYFAYLLARAYAQNEQPFRAMFPLYRVFRDADPRVITSGKWIEIQAHLLLAHLYQSIGLDRRRDWDSHRKIEHEFEVAAMLADLNLPDTGVEGYELVASSGPDLDWKRILESDLKELGYEMPRHLSLDSKRLRAMVHHSYSAYLLKQPHHEHAALKHEAVVTEVLPEFGEAYLNCATAAMQLGDSRRALNYLALAPSAKPQYMDELTFAFMLARGRWLAHADLGDIELARHSFAECREIALKEPLSSDTQLQTQLSLADRDPGFWQRSSRLAQMRDKVFDAQLTYRLPAHGIEVVLPPDWKIDRESCSELEDRGFLIAIFASPLTWDSTTKSPSDASVNLFYTTETEHLERDAQSFGLWRLEKQQVGFRNKCTWQKDPIRTTLGAAALCEWQFEIQGPWPKTGMLLAFALPHARIFLHLMCEVCGRSTFWKTLETVGQEFREQPIFKGC
jgi:tetratricopeptide (TPR) repeat protein